VTRSVFPPSVIESMRDGPRIGMRAGTTPHRTIGIWVVVVENRAFVRSWGLEPRSWWRTLAAEGLGVITVDEREIPVRAIRTRSERLKDAVSSAYRAKYRSPGSVQYAKDMGSAKSRATTTELVPLQSSRTAGKTTTSTQRKRKRKRTTTA
jgi:hypothetical protein